VSVSVSFEVFEWLPGAQGGTQNTACTDSTEDAGASTNAMVYSSCWPATWLAADIPSARLLSLEYAAPASGWEVGPYLDLPCGVRTARGVRGARAIRGARAVRGVNSMELPRSM
jgi:hypothetical protein